MAWYDAILNAVDRVAEAASNTLLRASEAVTPPPPGVTRKERRADRRASRRRLREPQNRAILREQAQQQRQRRREARRAPRPVPAPPRERAPRPVVEPGTSYILLEGNPAIVQPEYERSMWATVEEAYEAWAVLIDAGLAEDSYLALAFWPRRRLPYVVYVGPSPV